MSLSDYEIDHMGIEELRRLCKVLHNLLEASAHAKHEHHHPADPSIKPYWVYDQERIDKYKKDRLPRRGIRA